MNGFSCRVARLLTLESCSFVSKCQDLIIICGLNLTQLFIEYYSVDEFRRNCIISLNESRYYSTIFGVHNIFTYTILIFINFYYLN